MRKIIFIFFILTLVVYFLTSGGKTPYDYFTRLADSFLAGKYYLTQNPPWLNELIPWGEGKYHFVNPPMPAFLLVPFRFIFGEAFEQQYLAYLLGAGIVAVAMLISWSFRKSRKLLIYIGILAGVGNIIWYLSSVGSVWYLGQVSGAFFLLLAIYLTISKKSPIIIGATLSLALLSRLQILPSLLFFLFMTTDLKPAKIFKLVGGLMIFVFVYMYYNFIRFGSVFQTGYNLIPGVFNEPWFSNGRFSLTYIPRHLKAFLLEMPRIIKGYPYITPSWAGLAVWITTPVFVYTLLTKMKKKLVYLSWLSILGIAFINFSFGSTGFTQFGYRYAVDFYPFLILLTVEYLSTNKLKWHHWLLLFVGVAVNLWGVIWINKFGWVGF